MDTTTFNDKSTHHTSWDILTISDSKITDSPNGFHYANNDFNSYITSNHYNHSTIMINNNMKAILKCIYTQQTVESILTY